MKMGMPFIAAHLVAAIAGLLLAATTAMRPGGDKWIVVVLAAVGAAVNAGVVVAELV